MSADQEPSTGTGPVRRFRDPGYVPVANTLGELRAQIDALDEQIVALIAERGRCVRDATRFKADAFQVSAPARQALVFARARALASAQENTFPGLGDIVESTYRTLVASFVASEARLFDETERIEP